MTVPDGVRRWRLDASNGWGAALPVEGSVGRVGVMAEGVRTTGTHLALIAGAGGPLDPAAMPDTVGGLALPHALATGTARIYLGRTAPPAVLAFDADTADMRPAFGVEVLGDPPSGSEGLVLARAGTHLLTAWRRGTRIASIHTAAALLHDVAELPQDQALLDLAASGTVVVALTTSAGAMAELWWWIPGRFPMRRLGVIAPNSGGTARWPTRLLVDAAGGFRVFDASHHALARVRLATGALGPWQDLESVRDAFLPLPAVVEPRGADGWRLRVRPDGSLAGAPVSRAWLAFDEGGRPLAVRPDAPSGPPPYRRRGTVIVGPLDGLAPDVVWDRVEFELDPLANGTALRVQTCVTATPAAPLESLSPWSAGQRVVGSESADDLGPETDFAVLSDAGRYLWLKLTLEGGGATPQVRAVRIVFPRSGIAEFLPAVFQEADRETRFLARFMGALEATWRPLEQALDEVDRMVWPTTAPSTMLEYLATWFAEPLEPGWGLAARRRAIAAASRRAPRRGTPDALRDALQLFVANLHGVDGPALGAVPFIWEHFRSRAFHRLPAEGTEAAGSVLFGEEILRRLRVGTSRLGDRVLRDYGSPDTDPVTLDAHRFSVFVPRTLVPTETDLRRLVAVLDRERPAHAAGDVVLVEPRLRVGVQATLGVDTALGAYPLARLAATASPGFDMPPAILDYDCVLASGDVAAGRPPTALGGAAGSIPWHLA